MIRVVRELHECPATIAGILERAGGRNRFGGPLYRAVWGRNRLAWIAGRFEDRDEHGHLIREVITTRLEPKYNDDRWHIEKWCPPETYGSPEEWQRMTSEVIGTQNVCELGPYPERGDYEESFLLQTPEGGFAQLTCAIAERWARMIQAGQAYTAGERRAALYREHERAEREYDAYADAVLSDGVPAFHGQPHVTVAA